MTTDAWLATFAEGLDLSDPEDRAIFRGRLEAATKNTKVSAINEWAKEVAHGWSYTYGRRAAALRNLAAVFILFNHGIETR